MRPFRIGRHWPKPNETAVLHAKWNDMKRPSHTPWKQQENSRPHLTAGQSSGVGYCSRRAADTTSVSESSVALGRFVLFWPRLACNRAAIASDRIVKACAAWHASIWALKVHLRNWVQWGMCFASLRQAKSAKLGITDFYISPRIHMPASINICISYTPTNEVHLVQVMVACVFVCLCVCVCVGASCI